MNQENFVRFQNKIGIFPETMDIDGINLVGKLEYLKATEPISSHIHHNMLEICYLHKGHQRYVVGGEDFDVEGGDVFITFPDEKHGTGQNPEEKSVLYWVLVDVENKNLLGLFESDRKELVDALMGMNRRHFKGESKLKVIIDEFIEVSLEERPFKKIILRNLMINFLLEIIGLHSKSFKRMYSEDIDKITRYIKEKILENFEISELAKKVNLSESRFKQKFMQQTGFPPKEYIWREKIKYAKTLMSSTHYSITAIAIDLNFGSSQYFSEVFKRFTGQTPNEYRKLQEQCNTKL